MAATPQYGSMVFQGISGKKYSKDVYFSDVASGLARWDAGVGAGSASPTEWRPPEIVALRDFAVVTGMADTTRVQLTRNGIPTGDIYRYTIHLTTLNNRPTLSVPFLRGDVVAGIQLA